VSDINRDRYHGFSVGIMLTTNSGLRADIDALNASLRTEANLRNLIRHNLYYTESGVQNGQLNLKPPPVPPDVDLESVVSRLNVQAVVDAWATLDQAANAINGTIRPLLGYDEGGSCPAHTEQPALFQNMGAAGSNVPGNVRAARK
jgi:hypothetical protein